jgi:hypothetical protein
MVHCGAAYIRQLPPVYVGYKNSVQYVNPSSGRPNVVLCGGLMDPGLQDTTVRHQVYTMEIPCPPTKECTPSLYTVNHLDILSYQCVRSHHVSQPVPGTGFDSEIYQFQYSAQALMTSKFRFA